VAQLGWQGLPAVQSVDNADYSLLTAMKYNLERIIALLDNAGLSGSGTSSALQQSLSEVDAELAGMNAAIRIEQTARINADEALSQQIQQIIATGDGSNTSYLQTTEPTSPPYTLNVGDLWFDSDNNFLLHRWSGSAWAPVDDQRILANTAAISAEQSARITADEALATNITALTSVVNSNYSTLQASIATEATTRATADTAISTRVDTLTATVTTNNSVTTARIAAEEQARATADAAATTRMNTMQSSIDVNSDTIADNTARIATEESTRAAADSAQASQITALNATVTKQTGDIAKVSADLTTEATVRASADSALGTQITNLTATVNGQGTSLVATNARITTEEQVRASADTALSTRVDAVVATNSSQQTDIINTQAMIVTEQTARANADSALAVQITTVSSTVNGQTAQIQQLFNSVNGIYAEYTLTVQAGGIITGIELISGGGQSDFIVKADRFRIENSSGIPFEVIGGITYLRNVVIQEAAIGTIKLQENATFDFDFFFHSYGTLGTRPTTPSQQWINLPVDMLITVIPASGTTQVVSINTSMIMEGSGSNPDLIDFRIVRVNDGKILQTYTNLCVLDNRVITYNFEFYDEAPIADTPCTYRIQLRRTEGGSSRFYSTSMRGVVYKR
jgi:hypothetical protein